MTYFILAPCHNPLHIQTKNKAVEAGKAGLESTRNIVATKGRAMRLGERAIGHLDPGAASAAEILEVFYKDMPN